ncbi:hypothetical protein KOR42_05090 [Thalassoglobus neptunius]|uniref:Uncharacterized protein n=1 Tax=Thalassoglobus neptunius TaxID=1938619 RepID=A0A5C5X497_9PLAN|nr:hypothetical protein [Thalassoglobus neptunius]TWT57151.1 hypothetical protein KOR42_05090 [Thalassoglobus neptunius]
MDHGWFHISNFIASLAATLFFSASPLEVEHFHFDGNIQLSAVSTDTFEMRVFRMDKDSSIPHPVGIYPYQPGGTDRWERTDYVRWECSGRIIRVPHDTTEVFGHVYRVNDDQTVFIRRIDWKRIDAIHSDSP